MAEENRFKLVMENAVRPFMENKPAVYLLLIIALSTTSYTAVDLMERMGIIGGETVVVESVPTPVAAPPVKKKSITREVIRQSADCQPLIDKTLIKHEKKKHG